MTINAKQRVHNHIFYELTRSLCPQCRQMVDAKVLIRDGGVYLRKYCPEHGWYEALVSSDADWYLGSLKFNKPGTIPYDFTLKAKEGCPYDCGLCPEHQQHTCIGVIEITERCNLSCPTCFADAGHGNDLSLSQVEAILDRLKQTEGEAEIVQISGGEPTLHPKIMDILALAKSRNIRHVMLNTNGLKLAQEPEFVRQLASYQPSIYLQFDGLTANTYTALRGRDLLNIKRQALDNLAEAGMNAILVATIVRGVNESEIGEILHFALNHPAVSGICYQPVTFCGRRRSDHDPLRRITLPDVLHNLEIQTEGMFRMNDFFPVPCPHPTCSACTYAYRDGNQIIPITRLVNVEDYLDFLTNRTVADFSEELKSALESLWSMAAVMSGERTTSALSCAACGIDLTGQIDSAISAQWLRLSCAACGIDLTGLDFKNLRERFFMIQVHGFMDEYNFDLKRLMKCCVHQLLPDGRAVPFCAYNNLGYRQQVKRDREAKIDR